MMNITSVSENIFNYVYAKRFGYFGKNPSEQDSAIFKAVLSEAAKWAEQYEKDNGGFYTDPLRFPPVTGNERMDRKFNELYALCKNHVNKTVDFKQFKPVGFAPVQSLLLSILIPMLVKWVVTQVVDYLIRKYFTTPDVLLF